jgi:hypothetical protein
MRLMGSERRMPSLMGYGLEVSGFVAADSLPAPAATAHDKARP